MGKGVVRGQPGASASAEGARTVRAAARRGLVSGPLALVATAIVAAGVVTRAPALVVVGGAGIAGAWHWRPRPDPGRWHRGAAGEVATARLLARLPRRFVALHDRRLPGSRGNMDHLVIARSGVWIIDSKVRRARLRVHRGHVWAGDHPIDVAPVARQAAGVSAALGVPVAAVVAVHGAGLRRRGRKVGGVRVLPAERLVRRLRRGRRLAATDVVALAARADEMFPSC